MRVIYISGPINADGWEGVYRNIQRARAIARRFWLEGWSVVCPHTNTAFMDGPDMPPRRFLDGDLEIIRRCDSIFMMPGWEASAGACEEHAEAQKAGIEIIYGKRVS